MDRLILEKVEKEIKVETEKKQTAIEQQPEVKETDNLSKAETQIQEEKAEKIEYNDSYVSSFENLTISDVKQLESEEEKTVEEESEKFSEPQVEQEVEKEQIVLQETQEQSEPVKKLVIERPNYDFIGDKKTGTKKKKKSKLKAALLCCTLAACCVGCVTGSIVIDNLNSQYIALQDEYSLNLATYLRNINNLNATNQGLEFIETYPEDINEISSIGETTNWFDNLSNFIAGIFGG